MNRERVKQIVLGEGEYSERDLECIRKDPDLYRYFEELMEREDMSEETIQKLNTLIRKTVIYGHSNFLDQSELVEVPQGLLEKIHRAVDREAETMRREQARRKTIRHRVPQRYLTTTPARAMVLLGETEEMETQGQYSFEEQVEEGKTVTLEFHRNLLVIRGKGFSEETKLVVKDQTDGEPMTLPRKCAGTVEKTEYDFALVDLENREEDIDIEINWDGEKNRLEIVIR